MKSLQQEQVVTSHDHELPASLRNAQDIARAEMARRRRKLGNLTPEQEMNIEKLLLSTASKVSKMIAAINPSTDFTERTLQ